MISNKTIDDVDEELLKKYMVSENNQLKEEIKKLKEVADIELNIERHKDTYITLKNDSEKLIYCSCC